MNRLNRINQRSQQGGIVGPRTSVDTRHLQGTAATSDVGSGPASSGPVQTESETAVRDWEGQPSSHGRKAMRAVLAGLFVLGGFLVFNGLAPKASSASGGLPLASASVVPDLGSQSSKPIELTTQVELQTRPIASIRPGQRVLAENPELAGIDVPPLQIEPDQWRLISLTLARQAWITKRGQVSLIRLAAAATLRRCPDLPVPTKQAVCTTP